MGANSLPRPPARTGVLFAPAAKANATLRRRECGLVCIALGRGRTGKTLTLRALIELALRSGRLVVPADGDRFNQSLATYAGLGRAMRPASARDEAFRAWLEDAVGYAAEQRAAVGLDLGGGDRSLIARADEVMARVKPSSDGLAAWGLDAITELTGAGVDLTILYHLAGGADDARGLALLNRTTLVGAPMLLVLNEGLAPDTRADDPFAANLRDPAVKTALERGASVVRLPALPPHIAAFLEEHRLGFADAVAGVVPEGVTPLGLWDRQTLAEWLRRFATLVGPHAGLLP